MDLKRLYSRGEKRFLHPDHAKRRILVGTALHTARDR